MTRRMYEVSDEVHDVRPRVLIHALSAGAEAGHVGALVAQHLSGALSVRRLVTFDSDEFIDYRSRRPLMVFSESTWSDYAKPVIAIDLLRDDEGEEVLLLHGPEPDLRWSGFVESVVDLVEYFDVGVTAGVHSIPMAVPHTRPTVVTPHATSADLVSDPPFKFGTVQVPGSVPSLLELTLGQHGHDAMGFTAHVPHYLAHVDVPQAAAEVVRHIARFADLALPVGDLEAAATANSVQIERQVSESAEVAAVVAALERQYDSFVDGMGGADDGARSLASGSTEVPSADEIAAELEMFLAERDDPDRGGSEAGRTTW